MSETATTYDEVPYTGYAFPSTHPQRLAAVGTLLGMRPPPTERCRVLELGCGVGGNLIPMALGLPGGHFVGVDLSRRQIEMGQEVVRTLGLTNIELRALSILDVDASLGRFDYVICHGVYSWVPPPVQDKILDVCRDNLQPDGIAYVSYNTYPGWHVRGMVREMLRYHAGQFPDPQEAVGQARSLLDFMLETVGDKKGWYAEMLRLEVDLLAEASDTYIYHEHLEEVNQPLYFHQFAARAAVRGLQYVAEVDSNPLPSNVSPTARDTLLRLAGGDLIQGEQYLDFLRFRTFRRTLLCHAAVPLRRPPAAQALETMYITGLVRPVSEQPDVTGSGREEFRSAEGASLATNYQPLKAALVRLAEAGRGGLPFAELWAAVGAPAGTGKEALTEPLLQCYLGGLVNLHVSRPDYAQEPTERPVASPLARLQAADKDAVTNLCHDRVRLNPFECLVLRQLDGTRNRTAILDALVDAVRSGAFALEWQGRPVQESDEARRLMGEALEPTLRRMARAALLVR
ncbi:MAG: class I SAM-dependent methyltransferase [Gemmataceae bacterium]|nr:class I SAM-dependent methyltransferase [Gemmataceae bacterium]